MICPKCNGRKYIELDKIGLVVAECPECKGTGEVEDVLTQETIDAGFEALSQEATYIGLYFRLAGKQTDEYSKDELWMSVKEAAIEKMEFPYIAVMPCGHKERFDSPASILNLSVQDIPCPCGNPKHYIVKFVDEYEVANDSNDGTERDNQPARSGDTSKSGEPKKQKAKRKARKRIG